MDNMKTGQLIAAQRRALNLTQDELAAKLHVTGKAVSKWERGLSFPSVDLLIPLAETLGVNVTDLLAGEIIPPPEREQKAEVVVVETLTDAERTKRRARLALDLTGMLIVVLLLVQFFIGWAPTLFQRGNPIPYLVAAAQLTDERTYVPVGGEPGVYIARRGDCPALFDAVEAQYGVRFVEQAGSGYVFANETTSIVVSSEIYWGHFTVWHLPTNTIESP